MTSYQYANYFNEGSIHGGGTDIYDEDTMERIQQYMNGQITTSTIANANGNWQFHEKANDKDVYKRQLLLPTTVIWLLVWVDMPQN